MSAWGGRPVPVEMANAQLGARKRDHLRIAAGPGVTHVTGAGFDSLACATGRCPSATSATCASTCSCLVRGCAHRSWSAR